VIRGLFAVYSAKVQMSPSLRRTAAQRRCRAWRRASSGGTWYLQPYGAPTASVGGARGRGLGGGFATAHRLRLV